MNLTIEHAAPNIHIHGKSFGEDFTITRTVLLSRLKCRIPSDALIEGLSHKLDRFVACAFDIPPSESHPQHDAALEKCAGLVIWLDIKREPFGISIETIAKVLPAFTYLLGRTTYSGWNTRKKEMDNIRETLKEVAAITPAA